MALGGQVVDLIRSHLLNDADEAGRIRHVPIVQDKVAVGDVRILVEMVNPVRVEERGTALDAMHLVALFEQEFGKVGTVLTGNPGDQSFLHHYLLGFVLCAMFFNRSNCAATIFLTISSKLTVGSQPSRMRAFEVSASVCPDSSGRTSAGSLTTLSRQSLSTQR